MGSERINRSGLTKKMRSSLKRNEARVKREERNPVKYWTKNRKD
jgi:hypothetical protein